MLSEGTKSALDGETDTWNLVPCLAERVSPTSLIKLPTGRTQFSVESFFPPIAVYMKHRECVVCVYTENVSPLQNRLKIRAFSQDTGTQQRFRENFGLAWSSGQKLEKEPESELGEGPSSEKKSKCY